MDHIVDNIDDTIPDDIVKPNDIDSREIRKMAFEKAGISQKPKKYRKKRVVFTLIAAVLAAAVLGTATAGASGSFDAVFGEYFAGESSEGLYPGGEVSIDVNSLTGSLSITTMTMTTSSFSLIRMILCLLP